MKKLLFLAILAIAGVAVADEGARETTENTSGTSAVTDKLSSGWKIVVCTVATHYRTGKSDVVSVVTDLTIPANTPRQLYINTAEQYIAFILDSSTGVCNVYRQTPGPTGVPPMIAATSHIITDAAVVVLDGGGSYTATVTDGTVCVCSGEDGSNLAGCERTGTSLAITGGAGRGASYICST